MRFITAYWRWLLAGAIACAALTFSAICSRGPRPDTSGYHAWEHRCLLQGLLAAMVGFAILITMAAVAVGKWSSSRR